MLIIRIFLDFSIFCAYNCVNDKNVEINMKTEFKKIRLSNNMTQNDVCEELKKYGYYICRSTYTKYETGSRPLPCDILVALTKCFNTSADEILGIK